MEDLRMLEERTVRVEICRRFTDHLCSTASFHYDTIITHFLFLMLFSEGIKPVSHAL